MANIFDDYIQQTLNKETKKHAKSNLRKLLDDKSNTQMFIQSFNDLPNVIKCFKQNKATKELKVLRGFFENDTILIKDLYFNNISKLYNTTIILNDFFNLYNTQFLYTKEPSPIVYGINIENEKILPPLDFEYLDIIIETQINSKIDIAGKLIYESIMYSEAIFENIFGKNSNDEKLKLEERSNKILKKLQESKQYQNALKKYLEIENLDGILNILKKGQTNLSEDNDTKYNKHFNNIEEVTESVANNKSLIEELKAEINELSKNNMLILKENNSIKQELNNTKRNFDKLLVENKYLKQDYEELKKNTDTEISNLKDKLNEATYSINNIRQENESKNTYITNINADLINSKNQISKLKDKNKLQENKSKFENTKDIIIAIKEHLNHFARSFNYFKNTYSFDKATLETCFDSMNSLLSSLEQFGVSTIGRTDEIVFYDKSLHHCEDVIEKKTKVKIINVGWKIGDKILSKAEVENMEKY